jgi:transcriptional regulator with XRE-family HTH domain
MTDFKAWIPSTVKRLRGDMTLKDLAAKAGVSLSYISDIEQGRTVPTIETLDRIFKACGAVLTLGYQEIPFASDRVSLSRKDIDAIRTILDKVLS